MVLFIIVVFENANVLEGMAPTITRAGSFILKYLIQPNFSHRLFSLFFESLFPFLNFNLFLRMGCEVLSFAFIHLP